MNLNDIILIAHRELKNILKSKIIFFQVVLLPFIGVVGYTLLIGNMNKVVDTDTLSDCYSVNTPVYIESLFNPLGISTIPLEDIEGEITNITEKKTNLLICFPDGFSLESTKLENIEIWYNSSNSASLLAFNNICMMLDNLQPKIFTINNSMDVKYDLGNDDDFFHQMVSMLLPVMLFMFTFMAVTALAAECIVGDRERGFLQTILVTPINRKDIAFGKALGIYIASILSGISGFTGILISLPQMASFMGVTKLQYKFLDYVIMFTTTTITMFTVVSIIILISALSDSVKKATSISPIIMFIIVILNMLTINIEFKNTIESLGMINNIVPLWNNVYNLQQVLNQNYSVANIFISCSINIIMCIIIIMTVSKLFDSEKILSG